MPSCCIGGCCGLGVLERIIDSCPSNDLLRDFLCKQPIAGMLSQSICLPTLTMGAATREHVKARHARSRSSMPMDAASYTVACLQAQRPKKERLLAAAMARKVGARDRTDKKRRQTR